MLKYSYDASGNVLIQAQDNLLAPQITGQPVKQVAEPGDSATFSAVVADARAVTFQWQFNGTDIPGATGDSLLLTNVSAVNEGQYSVVVTNSAGSVTSTPAALLLDSNGNGLPDSWEIAHFGDLTSQRSASDADGDGISNLDEFLDGTDPSNKDSLRPRLIAYSGAGGSVTVTPMKLSYDLGETVTLTPTPFPPSVFLGWTGDLNGTDNPATLTMDRNKTVRARFASAVPLPPGLIALWRGETDASDLIGGHHGTFFAGPVVTVPSVTALGKIGGAFDFDGTVHVRVPDSADLRPERLTVEVWVFPTVFSSRETIIARESYRGNNNVSWYLGLGNTTVPEFSLHDNREDPNLRMVAPFAIPLNEWTHLAVTFDGSSKRMYINGVLVVHLWERLGVLVYGSVDAPSVPVTIGSFWSSKENVSSLGFTGRIDEVALYNRALTAEEVLGIYNADAVGKNISQPYFTSPARLPDGILGINYTQQVATILGTSPVSFSLSRGVLPPGMTLSSTGLISGIPSTLKNFGFTVRATDAVGTLTEQECVLHTVTSVTAPAGQIGWWRAENNAQDAVGTNHGMLRNGTGFAAGQVGQAFALNGTNNYIEIPDEPTLRPVSVTLEAWARFAFDETSQAQCLFAKPWGSNYSYLLFLVSGTLGGEVSDTTSALSAPFSPESGSWHHLAYTFDDGTKQQVLYIDGLQVASGSANFSIAYDDEPLLLGCSTRFNVLHSFLHGGIDEAAIYNRALSGAEIASIFNAGAAGKQL